MKKLLISLLLLGSYVAPIYGSYAQTTPLSLSAVKNLITTKLTPIGTDRVTAQKMREVTNTLAEQLDLKAPTTDLQSVLANTQTRTAFQSVAQLRAMNLSSVALPAVIAITDKGKEGEFVYRPGDASTPDNGATVLVDAAGHRFWRSDVSQNDIRWWGAVSTHPDGVSAAAAINNVAIQNAIIWSAQASGVIVNGVNESLLPTFKSRSSIVRFPAGGFPISVTLDVVGNVVLQGEGGQSSGGTVLYMADNGQPAFHMFRLAGQYSDGMSNASVIRGIRFLTYSDPTTSYCIYSGTSGSYHSLRVEDCWFQIDGTHQGAYYSAGASDDVKFTNCTFDGVKTMPPMRLGNSADVNSGVFNFAFTNCTVYDFAGGFFQIERANGVLITGNRFYSATTRAPFVLNATSATKLERLNFVNNTIEKVQDVIRLGKNTTGGGGVLIANNTIQDVSRNFLGMSGAATDTLTGLKVTGNEIYGTWNAGDGYTPIQAHGGIKIGYSEFNNGITQLSGGTGAVSHALPGAFFINVRGEEVNFSHASVPQTGYKLINASNIGTGNNYSVEALRYDHFTINNVSTSTYNLILPVLPQYVRGRSIIVSRYGSSSGPVTLFFQDSDRAIVTHNSTTAQSYSLPTFGANRQITLTWDGYNWVATSGSAQEPNLTNITPLTTVIASTTVSTSGWAAGSYYPLIPANTLIDGAVYRLNLLWQKSGGGVDIIRETFTFIGGIGGGSGNTPSDFPGQITSYEYSPTNAVRVRPLKPTPGQVVGVAAALSDAAMVTPNGYIVYELYRIQ